MPQNPIVQTTRKESQASAVPTGRQLVSAKDIATHTRSLRETIVSGVQRGQKIDRWLTDNWRMILTALSEVKESVKSFVQAGSPKIAKKRTTTPRIIELARRYLGEGNGTFDMREFVSFVKAAQDGESEPLWMDEIWALKPAMQLALLEKVSAEIEGDTGDFEASVSGLRNLSDADWKWVFEQVSAVDKVLGEDPAGAYWSMDFESRDLYRTRLSRLAKLSSHSETEVAAMVVAMARESSADQPADPRVRERRRHVGFYLIDSGLPRLKERIGYRPNLMARLRDLILRFPSSFYMVGVELTTLMLVFWICTVLDTPRPIIAVIALLILPATHAAVHFMNNLATLIVGPRQLARFDFSEGIPPEYATAVAVPSLLLHDKQVRELVRDLHIRYLANPDPQLRFVLLSDSPDSSAEVDERDQLVGLASKLISDLNAEYGDRFYLLHRNRLFNPVEGKWMGWERKRGKLIDFNQYLRDEHDPFPIAIGDIQNLKRVKYVITLDSDTQLPRGSAQRLIGTLAHPLNRAVIDPSNNMVVAGYGILQPRIGVSIHAATKSWLGNIYSGQTGFDIYTRAVSDVYQDLFGEAIFTGKGIYEVDVFRTVLDRRFPNNTLLSHDLIEGAYARTGLVSDIELVDDFPSHFSAYHRRQHRWVRGDWQVMRWLLPVVPDYNGKPVLNPISLVSAWKILDNLRRSMIHPAMLTLLLAGWFWFSGSPMVWTLASLGLFLIPAVSHVFFAVFRVPRTGLRGHIRGTLSSMFKDAFTALLQFVFLVHQSLLSMDAIVRSLFRTVKGQRLLEWETAAESEASRRKTPVDKYLEWTPYLALLIGILLTIVRPAALPAAIPALILWVFSRSISNWLNAQPEPTEDPVSRDQQQHLRVEALRMWRYFCEFSTEKNHWLIPDNVRQDGLIPAPRVSPTNLGLLLNARLAALEFGWITLAEFATLTRRTLETTLRMKRYRGHLLNWYSTDTLEVLPPAFVSTVDSGNVAVCLWTQKAACLDLLDRGKFDSSFLAGLRDYARLIEELEPKAGRALNKRFQETQKLAEETFPALEQVVDQFLKIEAVTSEALWWARQLRERLTAIRAEQPEETLDDLRWSASTCAQLVQEMDFSFLYVPKRKALTVGFDTEKEKASVSCYDMLATEARLAAFVAIAKGDAPQEVWLQLGRGHTLAQGRKVLMSWSGTMFEYLMPALWMRHYPETLLARSAQEIAVIQQKYGRRHNMPWGVSECAHGFGDRHREYSYQAFGLPELALDPGIKDANVVAPYATFLALTAAGKEALLNLKELARLGMRGTYGYYEAIDYSDSRADVLEPRSIVRVWMVHHLGMSLLAVCNFLRGNFIQDVFHSEPAVEASERILHERIPLELRVDEIEPMGGPQLVPHEAASTAA